MRIRAVIKSIWFWAHRLSAKSCARIAIWQHHPQGKLRGWSVTKLYAANPPRGARTIFECTSPDQSQRMILKVYARLPSARQQYKIQQQIADKTPILAKPLFFNPVLGVLAIEYIPGPLLASLFYSDRQGWITKVGMLLKQFHNDARTPMTLASPDPFKANWDVRAGDAWPNFVPQLVQQLSKIERQMHPDLQADTLLFYDLHLENIIRSETGLRLIDRSREGHGFIETDIARFLFHIFALDLLRNISLQKALEQHMADRALVLTAYGAAPELSPLLDHALDREALRRWIHAKHRSNQPKRVVTALENWVEDMKQRILPNTCS